MRVDQPPEEVAQYVEGCARAVEKTLGVRLDLTPDTLPILDHYVDRLREGESRVGRDPVTGLVAVMAGVYFGELVRLGFPCRWRTSGGEPAEWRIEFLRCVLMFYPVAVAWEVILRHDDHDLPSGFYVDEAERSTVRERLAGLPGARPDEYYSFSQRWETLALIAGWLTERTAREAKGRRRRPAAAAYDALVRSIRTRG